MFKNFYCAFKYFYRDHIKQRHPEVITESLVNNSKLNEEKFFFFKEYILILVFRNGINEFDEGFSNNNISVQSALMVKKEYKSPRSESDQQRRSLNPSISGVAEDSFYPQNGFYLNKIF